MEKVLADDIRELLKKEFQKLKDSIHIWLFTQKGVNEEYNDFTRRLFSELSGISEKIQFKEFSLKSKKAKDLGIKTTPTFLLNPERYNIRFLGAPLGEEGRSIVASIMMVSHGHGMLNKDSSMRLKELREKREVLVFVSPTCPYCPQQVGYAVSAAIENPENIAVQVIEIYENRDLAEKFGVSSVPQTVINGNIVATGLQPEEVFVDSLFTGAPVEMKITPTKKETIKKDVLIVGAGPAGLTAAIYAERAGLKTVVVEKGSIGGQVAVTPIVENYPGYTRIPGKVLMDMMAQQALQYTEIHQGEEVVDIKRTKEGLFNIKTTSNRYQTRAVILATGAEHKKLGVPGEKRFFGRGVSYCATCDGYFFRGRKVIMVGGGNSAVTEALYLESIGVDVTLVHRRDVLRAEARLQENIKERKIPILYDTIVEEILGETVVKAVRLKNLKEKRSYEMKVDGVFIAIGYVPINSIAKKLKLKLDQDGYIVVDERQRTSMPGVYACGDVTGGIKQIVTAVGQGSVAAITAFEDLMNPYWRGKEDMF